MVRSFKAMIHLEQVFEGLITCYRAAKKFLNLRVSEESHTLQKLIFNARILQETAVKWRNLIHHRSFLAQRIFKARKINTVNQKHLLV